MVPVEIPRGDLRPEPSQNVINLQSLETEDPKLVPLAKTLNLWLKDRYGWFCAMNAVSPVDPTGILRKCIAREYTCFSTSLQSKLEGACFLPLQKRLRKLVSHPGQLSTPPQALHQTGTILS